MLQAADGALKTFDPFADFARRADYTPWRLSGLDPLPEAEWRRMREFLGLGRSDIDAMLATVEPLFRRGHELVVNNYNYLMQNPETAAILGWDDGADEAHLSERRRFFTVWLARTLGMDLSDDLARYLFRAGKLHAAHGPRRTHVPPVYITGAISLVNATFARFLTEEMAGDSIVPAALAGWNKVLSMHLHLMLLGYQAARAVDEGSLPLNVAFFARLRNVTGCRAMTVHVNEGAPVNAALRKLFNYFPAARAEVLEMEWEGGERLDAHNTPWFTVAPTYHIKPMWRVLLNGKDLAYSAGTEPALQAGDELHIFPPGR